MVTVIYKEQVLKPTDQIGTICEDAQLFNDGHSVILRYNKRNMHGCVFSTATENVPFWEKLKKGVKIKIFYDELGNIHHVELKEK